jgi:hypothetical protein
MTINELTSQLSKNVYPNEEKKQFDPLTILMITSIIVNIIRIIQNCQLDDERLKDKIKNPHLFDKIRLRRAVLHELRKANNNDLDKEIVVENLYKMGYNIDTRDIQNLYQEVKDGKF